jgi:hypothetical protein
MGNGDMLSTTADLWRWHLALRDTVLSTESRRKLFTRHARDYGYGWRVVEGPQGRLAGHDWPSSYGSSCLSEVADDSERVQRYRELIRRLHGDVTVARTIPSHLAVVPATHVGSVDRAIAFYWGDGKLLGLGEGDPAAGYQVRLPRADGGYLAYVLRLGRTVGVEFAGDRLALMSNGRTMRAERL